MGLFTEYIDKKLDAQQLQAERKKLVKKIAKIRKRDVLVIAADIQNEAKAPNSIDYSDLLPVQDQLTNLKGKALDLILETPGGSGEVAEDIVSAIRGKYDDVAVIIPGTAKSAGTIIAMSGNEILMEQTSSLGPIDAQIIWQGKVFSAHALLEGFEDIKQKVDKANVLSKAYIPILQGISPGELQHAENALSFARELVTKWLAKYKFQNWDIHSSTGKPVTEDEKRNQAEKVASQLCDQNRWRTHGRSIKIPDLLNLGLKIEDYGKNAKLADAIRRYFTLMQMTFNSTNTYKIFETHETQILRFAAQAVPLGLPGMPNVPQQMLQSAEGADIDYECIRCHSKYKVQANFGKPAPLKQGCVPFPKNDKLKCPNCGIENDMSDMRRQLESQTKKKIV